MLPALAAAHTLSNCHRSSLGCKLLSPIAEVLP